MTEMFAIEEESGTCTGSLHGHDGYYAGDSTRNPRSTVSELSALAKLQPPAFPITSKRAGWSVRPAPSASR